MIPAKAKNVEAAKKFLTFVASPEAQQIQVEKAGRIVTNKNIPMELYPAPTQKGIQMMQGVDELAQFYDRDTVPEMADKGMDGFMEFWYKPDNIGKILDRLEKTGREFSKSKSLSVSYVIYNYLLGIRDLRGFQKPFRSLPT
jgi:ABC-type glycerol-3-phosphate transport system substrate-binding protein